MELKCRQQKMYCNNDNKKKKKKRKKEAEGPLLCVLLQSPARVGQAQGWRACIMYECAHE